MPVITITLGQKQVTPKQSKQLIEAFTSSAVDITRLPAQAFTILINELPPTNIGVGGVTLEEKLRSS